MATAPRARPIARWARNRAQAYNSVGAWLDGKKARRAAKVVANYGSPLGWNLVRRGGERRPRCPAHRTTAAQRMTGNRFQHGALDLETIETRPVNVDQIVDIARLQKTGATSLIEEFMGGEWCYCADL